MSQVETTLMKQAKQGDLQWTIRQHDAVKRGKHLDLVVGSPNSQLVAGFVISKYKSLKELKDALKTVIKPIAVLPMELHQSNPYLTKQIGYTKTEPPGYGAGPFKIVAKGVAIQKGEHRSFELQGLNAQFYHFREGMWFLKLNK